MTSESTGRMLQNPDTATERQQNSAHNNGGKSLSTWVSLTWLLQESKELLVLQHCFNFVISADYQQAKFIPYWGNTEQPGSTYKVSNDFFGITDHRENKGSVYLFNEHIGPKNTDHTLSFLTMYWNQFTAKHPWIKQITILLEKQQAQTRSSISSLGQ